MTRTVTTTVKLPIGHDDPDTPASKAAHVADLARAYRDVYDDGEQMEVVIADMIADLLHLADTLAADDRIDPDGDDHIGHTVADKALMHYDDETDA